MRPFTTAAHQPGLFRVIQRATLSSNRHCFLTGFFVVVILIVTLTETDRNMLSLKPHSNTDLSSLSEDSTWAICLKQLSLISSLHFLNIDTSSDWSIQATVHLIYHQFEGSITWPFVLFIGCPHNPSPSSHSHFKTKWHINWWCKPFMPFRIACKANQILLLLLLLYGSMANKSNASVNQGCLLFILTKEGNIF